MSLNEAQKKERATYLEQNLVTTECSQRKPFVFISYASDNWERVFKDAVVPLQKQYGLRVYADKAFDKVNDKWIVPMLRNVRGADAMVVFVSQSYIESYACFLELLTAVNNKKQIVFVSLGEELHLGDTTDQPNVERGAKKEILNQGGNISTNTNNTSNDIMRAMKSAYTSLSTLLEQDALSKYDISDAFINFFQDASINRKTIHDILAVKDTIRSISQNVFDPSAIPYSAPVAGHVDDRPKEHAAPAGQGEEPVPHPQPGFAPVDEQNAEHVRKPDAGQSAEPVWKPDTGQSAEHVRQPDAGQDIEIVREAGAGQSAEIVRKPDARQGAATEQRVPPASAHMGDKSPKRQGGSQQLLAKMYEKPGTFALVTGIVSFSITMIPWLCFFAIPLSIYGMSLGIRGVKSGKKAPSVIGLFLNGIVLLIFIVVIL